MNGRVFPLPSLCLPISILGQLHFFHLKNWFVFTCLASLFLTAGKSLITLKKKLTIFPFPAGMSLTKLSRLGIIIPGQGEFCG
jgi:hypothetical protein